MLRMISPRFVLFALIAMGFASTTQNASAQKGVSDISTGPDKFRQLEELLPTPSNLRNASGAPGKKYWQQRADYEIDVEIDDEKQRIIGSETITYHNNSPDTLNYLWLQLDPNLFAKDSDGATSAEASTMRKLSFAPGSGKLSFNALRSIMTRESFDGKINIRRVADAKGRKLPYTIVKTMMRVDLPKPLASGESFKFQVRWDYNIVNAKLIFARGGYEYFEKNKNYIYEMAQWFPRMAAYTDVDGWQHKQFIGTGEFTLEMGDYLVRITVPEDHIVAGGGELQNPDEVLTKDQRKRLKKSRTAKRPMFIVTPEEAKKNESKKEKPEGKKTWVFKADNVRDFAFASSRKFIWDAMGCPVKDGDLVMAMSYYPNEGEPLWSKYSTQAIAVTLEVYSKYLFPYPYPVAISVNGPVRGMEYPMICFNGPRPEKDGTYSDRIKRGLISVVIHEVGHNWFPMIVNSDERQWTWMDEGLNTFMQMRTEQEWADKYPSRRGFPHKITGYMTSPNQVPIMTNSESILQFSNNAYAKPATALQVLRETILGRELFDFAFKQYAQRWRFKRPMPADFFRTMEDASGVDLDWFFRGWFYTTDHVDIGIDRVRLYKIDTRNPKVEKPRREREEDEKRPTLREVRDEKLAKRVDAFPELKDFYDEYHRFDITEADKKEYDRYLKSLNKAERKLLESKKNFYVVEFSNHGGLVMPLILEIEFEDESKQELRIPAEIWRRNAAKVSKLIITSNEIKSITLDPQSETADANVENNHFPRKPIESRFQLYKDRASSNLMQRAKREEAAKKKAEAAKKKAKDAKKKAEAAAAKKKEEAKKAADRKNSDAKASTENDPKKDQAKKSAEKDQE